MRVPPFLVSLARGLGSLRLTVWLLALAIVLVFFGTLDQVRIGIREAQKIYFESLIAVWHYPETWPGGGFLKWIPVPIPGGYLIGPLLAINLVCSHIRHFTLRWRLAGITLIHTGIIMLLFGQLVTNLYQKDNYMWLDEGESANFVRSFTKDELYLLKYQDGGRMGVYSVPFESLKAGKVIDPDGYPFEVRVREVYGNAEIKPSEDPAVAALTPVNQGIGDRFNLQVREIASFHSDDQRDIRTAVVELVRGGDSLGTWLVSNVFEDRFPEQEFTVDGRRYAVGLRFKKTYLPFTVTLLEFTHDRYPGTNIPRNFASEVRITHPGRDDEQEYKIFMNHPMRYEGLTFYQASFAKQDMASMFHVVRNPGRLLPYIACILVSIGLLYQFAWLALRSIRRSKP